MSSTPELKGVAQNVNDSIRTNETSLTHLEEQIDALTDALVSVNYPIEMQAVYEEERAKLLQDITQKTQLLNKTLEELKDTEQLHQKEIEMLQERNRLEKDSLVDQLRTSQAELMEYYSRIDLMECETERLEWELSRADEKYKRQNENLIDQNNALMHALQVDEQNKSRDVIEDLERSLQTVPLDLDSDFERNMANLSSEEFEPTSGSSPAKDLTGPRKGLEVLKHLKKKINELGLSNEEMVKIIDDLEKAIIRETALLKRYNRKCGELLAEIDDIKSKRPTQRQLDDVQYDLEENTRMLEKSQKKVQELEKVLVTTLSKHENLVADLNRTIDSQDQHIEQLKKKNFYPKLMDDLKKENSKLKEEVKKLNSLVKESPSRKVGGLKNKFEEKINKLSPDEKKPAKDESSDKIEKLQVLHREEVNHLKGKLMILEKKLNQSLEENTHLNQELSYAMEQLDDNSFNYESVIQDLQHKLENSILEDMSINVDESVLELKQHLETEKQRNKDLSSKLVTFGNSIEGGLPAEIEPLPPPPPEISITAPSPRSGTQQEGSPTLVLPKPNPLRVLTDKLNEVRKENEEGKFALEGAEKEVKHLQNRIIDLEEQIFAQNEEIVQLKADVKRGISVSVTPIPKAELENLELNLEDSMKDNVHLEETIAILSEEHEAQIKALNARVSDLENELEVALGEADPVDKSLIEQLENEKKTRINLEKRVEELEFDLQERLSGKDSEESLNNLAQNLDEAEKMCEKLMLDDEELITLDSTEFKKRLKSKDDQINRLQKENDSLKSEIEQLNCEFAEISTEIAEADNQYGQRIENLQKQVRMNQDEHKKIKENLEEEIRMLNDMLEEEKHSDWLQVLEKENYSLKDECKVLTDRLALDILSKISPVDEKRDVIAEMRDHFEKGHNRLKTEVDLKKQKIADLQEDIRRINSNNSRKIASLKERQDIEGERHKLQIEEHLLTTESLKKELEQAKRVNKCFEQNLEDKNVEFNEVVTKLLNLENLIEIQQDNLLAKDEQYETINRQLKNLKAELEIAQQRHNILREESIALDILENSLNEASEHDKRMEAEIIDLNLKLEKAVFDKEKAETDKRLLEIKACEQPDHGLESEKTIKNLKRNVEDLEMQIEDLLDQEESLRDQIKALKADKDKLEKQITSLVDNQRVDELERTITMKERTIEEKNNEINTILNRQDKTKQELVTKNVELQSKYHELMEKCNDLETENSCLLEDIDTNFKVHTESVRQLETEIKDLKSSVAEKEESILKSEEIINKAEAKNLADSQAFFESRKQLEMEITYLKTKLMDYEGGDAVRRSSSVHSVWLEDTASLNHVIGEKDRQIRDLRDSLKRSSLASSQKGSICDLTFKSASLGSIAPPTELEIQGGYIPEDSIAMDDYKKQIEDMQVLMDKKDEEYSKLYKKFKQELERQTSDSNVYNAHIKKLQKMVSLFEQQADKVTADNKAIVERSCKGINDINQSLTNLNDELMLENERTTEVLGELDLLKEDIESIQHNLSGSEKDGELTVTLERILEIEDNVQMTVEEHQCSLDHYQLLLQTTQQEMKMISEELRNAHASDGVDNADILSSILEILQEKVTLLADKLSDTKDEVTSSRFRGSQNGKSERENAIVIEQAELRCTKFENEIESIKNMLGNYDVAPDSEQFIKVTDELQEIASEMGDLKDLLSLKKSSPVLSKLRPVHKEYDTALVKTDIYHQKSHRQDGSVLEHVSLQEIDGLELITHDIRHQLREKIKECESLQSQCESLKGENANMNMSMRELQKVFGQMLAEKGESMDILNDTISAEKSVYETKLSQLSNVIEYKEKSQDQLRKTLSFEQGRVQQLKEDLDTSYERTFEHIKEYEGRVSTMAERLNIQQQQVKVKLETCEDEIKDLKNQLDDFKARLKEKEHAFEELESTHRRELRSNQRLLEEAREESMHYQTELEDLKNTFSKSHGSLDLQLSQYGDIMTKFKNEISEEKEAFQNSLQKLNFLVEDRTQKIKEYERIVEDLQVNLSRAQAKLKEKEDLNETLAREHSKLKFAALNQTSPPGDNDRGAYWMAKANKAEHQVKKLKQTIEDIKYRYETQLANKADEVLKANMDLEKLQQELAARVEKHDAIQNEVKSLKLDMEGAGSDNQVKDLEQKLAAKQSEVDEALYRMQRHQRETEALKDVLASYQNNADNDVAHKISEYETTIADYEVQVTMLKKNISDLHTQLHNTCDERQKVIEKAQAQIAVYQRRLEQMSDRVEDAKSSASKEASSFKDSKRQYLRQIALLEDQLKEVQTGGENLALRQKVARLERQVGNEKLISPDKDLQQRFELAVKRADHLQEQVDTMRKTNKRVQKTVEDLWAENTQLLKDLNRSAPSQSPSPKKREGSKRPQTKTSKSKNRKDIPNVIGSADI
ncbi:hypothetical protein ACHWQZ_G013602 [Mnemiopsis leidyi]